MAALLKNENLRGYQLMDKDHYPKPDHRFYFTYRSLENKGNLTISEDHQNKFMQAQVIVLSEGLLVETEAGMEHKHTDVTVT